MISVDTESRDTTCYSVFLSSVFCSTSIFHLHSW